jgi:hypothetical protein
MDLGTRHAARLYESGSGKPNWELYRQGGGHCSGGRRCGLGSLPSNQGGDQSILAPRAGEVVDHLREHTLGLVQI